MTDAAVDVPIQASETTATSVDAQAPDTPVQADTALPVAATDAALLEVEAQIEALTIDKSKANWRTKLKKPSIVTFTPGKTYLWLLHTDHGDLQIALRPDVAPMHVTSTLYLTMLGFYDSLVFHRIIKQFMAQGGDPLGTGTGGPGYKYGLEVDPNVKHDAAGVLSMANAGPGTEGSQFFLTFGAQPALDGSYSVFGKVIKGLETLQAIEAEGTVGEGTPGKVTILSATVAVQ